MSKYQVFNPMTGKHESHNDANEAAKVFFNYIMEFLEKCGPEILQEQELIQEGNTHIAWTTTSAKSQLIEKLKTVNAPFLNSIKI